MKTKRFLSLFMAAIMCFAFAAGCAGGQETEDDGTMDNANKETDTEGQNGADNNSDTIKIGFLGPLTGDAAQYGNACLNGARMYIDELNADGGLLGKQVELIYYDEKGDAVEALNAFNRLTSQDKVVAIIGDVTSAPTISMAEATNEAGIPAITPSATADEVTSFGNYMFRSCFLDPFQGETMARYAYEVLGARSAAVIWDLGSDYGVGLTNSFIETFESLGGSITGEENYSKDDVDFRAQLTNIQKSEPEVLFCPDYYNKVSMIAQQARELGLKSTFLGCDGWDGVLEVSTDTASLEGCFFSNHYSADDPSELVQNFLSNYRDLYDEEPPSFAATAYDAAMILCSAIEKAGSTDADEIVAQLDATDMECVTGHITFDENNNPTKSCAIITVQDGAYKLDRKY